MGRRGRDDDGNAGRLGRCAGARRVDGPSRARIWQCAYTSPGIVQPKDDVYGSDRSGHVASDDGFGVASVPRSREGKTRRCQSHRLTSYTGVGIYRRLDSRSVSTSIGAPYRHVFPAHPAAGSGVYRKDITSVICTFDTSRAGLFPLFFPSRWRHDASTVHDGSRAADQQQRWCQSHHWQQYECKYA
jgi:hypothetical protein